MRRSNRWSERVRAFAVRARCADDAGSAALEFIFGGLILLVPVVYLVVALGQIQHHALGVEAGARHIARAVSTAADAEDAGVRADAVLDTVTSEYGIDPAGVEVTVSCTDAAAACPAAGATVVVTVRASVPLLLVPPVLGLEHLASVPVEASAAQKVSRFWSGT